MTRPKALLALLVATAAVGYICRVAITVVAPDIMADFHLSQAQMGTVFSAFLVGYTACQVPSGWLADRVRARSLFLTLCASWAVLTAATAAVGWKGLAAGLPALLVVRALFGMTAAPTYPASARTVAVTISRAAQGAANGAVLASIGIGSAITPLMMGALITRWGWRAALLAPAAMAAVIALVWAAMRGDNPRPGQNRARMGHPQAYFRQRSYWFLCASYFLQGYIGYIFVFWFYLYLVQVRHFAVLQAAALTALPWIGTLIAIPAGGALSDYAVRRWGATRGRRSLPAAALMAGAVFLVAGARTSNAYLAVACLTACTVLVLCTEGPFWATMNQICGEHSGAGGGVMNFGSNLGGMISPALTPWLAERIGWSAALSFTAIVAVVAGLLWSGVAIRDRAPESPEPVPPRATNA
jgi:ACS family glucarate transporter-like MFS transporter